GVFGKNEPAVGKERQTVMCPACLVNATLLAVSATSGAGLTGIFVNRFCSRKGKKQRKEGKHENDGIEPRRGFGSRMAGGASRFVDARKRIHTSTGRAKCGAPESTDG